MKDVLGTLLIYDSWGNRHEKACLSSHRREPLPIVLTAPNNRSFAAKPSCDLYNHKIIGCNEWQTDEKSMSKISKWPSLRAPKNENSWQYEFLKELEDLYGKRLLGSKALFFSNTFHTNLSHVWIQLFWIIPSSGALYPPLPTTKQNHLRFFIQLSNRGWRPRCARFLECCQSRTSLLVNVSDTSNCTAFSYDDKFPVNRSNQTIGPSHVFTTSFPGFLIFKMRDPGNEVDVFCIITRSHKQFPLSFLT